MKRFLILAALLLSVIPVRAQEGYVPSAANLAAREQFAADRFGIFIHWGPAVLLDGGNPVPFRQEKGTVTLTIPPFSGADRVVALRFR